MKQLETDHSYCLRDLRLMPNVLTLLRAFLVIPWMTWAILEHSLWSFLASSVVYWLGDMLDGAAARRLNQCSRLGRDLDSSVDKLAAVVMLLAATVAELFPWRITLAIVTLNVIQMVIAFVGSRRFPGERQLLTYLPHAAGAALVLSLVSGPLAPYVQFSAVLLFANHTWYYSLGVFSEIRKFIHRLVTWTKRHAILHQWARKLNREVTEDHRILTLANAITFARALLIPVTLSVYIQRQWGLLGFLLVLFIAADGVDGMIARMNRSATVLGRFLDIVVDKMLLVGFFLLWFFEGRYSVELFIVLIARLAGVAILGTYASFFKRRMPIAFWSVPSNLVFLLVLLTNSPILETATILLNVQLFFHYAYQLARPKVVYG